MRTALCTIDGITYNATNFQQTDEFDIKRRFLECPECAGPAFYRGPSRNGREACFGARPHAEGCTLAALEHDGATTGEGLEDDEVLTTGQRIVLDLNYGTPEVTQGAQIPATTVATRNGEMLGVGGHVVRETMTRRLRPLLRSLVESAAFRRSTQTVEIPNIGNYTVADFFVNFGDVTQDHIGTHKGFWGLVVDARRGGNGTFWFNSGGREDMSVLLDQGFIGEMYQRFRLETDEDVVGAYILVVGELKVGPSGKKYVPIEDQSRFTLRLMV